MQRFSNQMEDLGRIAVRRGVPPSWLGYRWVRTESVETYLSSRGTGNGGDRRYRLIHPESIADNPLPRNWPVREALPADRGWWGYSFRDVPGRVSGPTFTATLPDCTVVPYVDPATGNFWVGILNDRQKALTLREHHFRAGHAAVLRGARQVARVERATWVIERVYHNYSHWLTAHLPKFLLLQQIGGSADVLLPSVRPAFVDASLRLLGIDPARFATFDVTTPLRVAELTVVGTDRFRPELLRPVREACPDLTESPPYRRLYISRSKAERRGLVNEDAIWPLLESAGFERVFMEDFDFPSQVRLMQETAVLCAPHGAGLTNMMFCRPGTHVVEIADLSFPNPNFYGVAAAMGHEYWLIPAETVGEGHPLARDMQVEPRKIGEVLEQLSQTAV